MSKIENGIVQYFHCKNCLQKKQQQHLAVGFTIKGFQVWCEVCDLNVGAFDLQGHKLIGDNNPKEGNDE